MNTTSVFRKGLSMVIALFLTITLAMSQNLNLNGAATLSGTWNVKGNINTTNATGVNTFSGTVNLNGSTALETQNIGAAGALKALVFTDLNAIGTEHKALQGTVTVNDAFVQDNSAGQDFIVGANTLNFGGTTLVTTGDFIATNTSSVVNYTSGSAQTILASTYGGTLGLSGAGAKDLFAATTAAIVTHSGGALTVDENLTIDGTGASTLDAISVTASDILDVTGTGGATIVNLTSNAGTIRKTSNAGTITFSQTALTNAATITASIGSLTFSGDVTNSGGSAVLSLTGTGTANFAEDLTNTGGTLTLNNAGTTVNYTGTVAQNVASTTYYTLAMSNGGVKTATGDVTIETGGSFNNNGTAITDMVTHILSGPSLAQAAGATMRFGGTNNGVLFTTGTVNYNASSGDQIIKGHATNRYATLTLTGGGTKTVADSDNDVTTDAGLTVNSGVELVVEATRTLLVGYTAGDLNLEDGSTVTNNGTITVGN